MKQPEGLGMRYLGGFAGNHRQLKKSLWIVRVDPDAFLVFRGDMPRMKLIYEWTTVRQEPWGNLKGLAWASSAATRANLPALAVFGVLGLAAHREPGTLLAVSYTDGDVFFSTPASPLEMRTVLGRLVEQYPALQGKLTFDGVVLGPAPSTEPAPMPSAAPTVTQQLRELGELRALGIVTDAEFEAKKAELLSRL